jgi:hypothetical protein
LTPSLLSAFNTVSIESPIKRATSTSIPLSDAFQRQASGGVIRKGGVESRIDVVTLDYVPPPKPAEVKRSRSTPAIVSRFVLSWRVHKADSSPESRRTRQVHYLTRPYTGSIGHSRPDVSQPHLGLALSHGPLGSGGRCSS